MSLIKPEQVSTHISKNDQIYVKFPYTKEGKHFFINVLLSEDNVHRIISNYHKLNTEENEIAFNCPLCKAYLTHKK